MSSTIVRYFHINKILMSQIGIWPSQSKVRRILIPSAIVFIEISGLTTEFSQMIRVFDTWCNINIVVECIITMLTLCVCFTKLFNLSFKIKKVQNLFSLIEYHWSVFINSTDVKILQDYIIFGKKVILFYTTIYIYISMVLYLIMPVMPQILDIVAPLNESRPRKFIFELDYFRLDKDKYYYVITFHSYVGVSLIVAMVVGVDTAYIMYVQHGCSLFAAIGYRLEYIASKAYIGEMSYLTKNKEGICRDMKDEDICLREKAIFRELVTCLRKHQLAIQYVNILESSFTLSTGMQLLANMIGISILGIQILNNLSNFDELIRYVCFIILAFFHLLCMSLPGQRLMDHSIDVFDKANIIPCTLTAGKIYVMSMTNFSGVVQSAMSYFMTFSSMN